MTTYKIINSRVVVVFWLIITVIMGILTFIFDVITKSNFGLDSGFQILFFIMILTLIGEVESSD